MALSDLVNDPYSAKRYLAEIGAYDISGTAATTVRVSDHGLVTGSGDSPAKTLYEARIIEPISFERSMFRSGKIGGASKTNFGTLVLGNADAGLDAAAGYAFDGRTVVVKVGAETDAYSDYTTIFTGTADTSNLTIRPSASAYGTNNCCLRHRSRARCMLVVAALKVVMI